jgi:hypothetical protein
LLSALALLGNHLEVVHGFGLDDCHFTGSRRILRRRRCRHRRRRWHGHKDAKVVAKGHKEAKVVADGHKEAKVVAEGHKEAKVGWFPEIMMLPDFSESGLVLKARPM